MDSHADGLCFRGDLPEGEEQADLLSVVQEQRVPGGLSFQESLQSLDGLFHLAETSNPVIKCHENPPTDSIFLQEVQICCFELASLLNSKENKLTNARKLLATTE